MASDHKIAVVGQGDVPEGMESVDPFKGIAILLTDVALEFDLGKIGKNEVCSMMRKLANTCFDMSNLLNDPDSMDKFESQMRQELRDDVSSFFEDDAPKVPAAGYL